MLLFDSNYRHATFLWHDAEDKATSKRKSIGLFLWVQRLCECHCLSIVFSGLE